MHSVNSEFGRKFLMDEKRKSIDVVIYCEINKACIQFPIREVNNFLELFDIYAIVASLPRMKSKLGHKTMRAYLMFINMFTIMDPIKIPLYM